MGTESVDAYIACLYASRTTLSQSLYTAATSLRDYCPVVADDVARLLKLLVRLTHPLRILGIGTSIGYSTTYMAQVVSEWGGTVTTIEFDGQVSRQARANLECAGVSDHIELLLGDAEVVLPQLGRVFDFILLDVDQWSYPPLPRQCVRLLKKGGLSVAEDTLSSSSSTLTRGGIISSLSLDEFNRLVAASPELESTSLTVGDGVTLAVRRTRNPG